MLIDAMYTEEEYAGKVGWGHATPQAVVQIAKKANVKQLVLSHHAPWRTDDQIDAIVDSLRPDFENVHGAASRQSYVA